MSAPILLLDIDGTLIDDRGYRHAQVEAARYVCASWGLPTHTPDEQEINMLHACGYSNEWDSTAFNVGINLVEAARGNRSRPDFVAWARRTTAFSGRPHERARDLLLSESPPHLHADIRRLLDDVSDPRVSPTTQLLYLFVLGSRRFEEHFGLKAALESPSFLETMDVPIPDAQTKQIIRAHPASAYTSRPSLPPDDSRPGLYQTPEAEIALAQLDMNGLPLVGLGAMKWLAEVKGGTTWDYAKPAPVQAIAAMLCAIGMPLPDAVLAAHAFATAGDDGPVQVLNGRRVIIIEDNVGGVRGGQRAAAILADAGIQVRVIGFGVARDQAKRAALAEVCDAVFNDVNAALAALGRDV